MDIQMDYREFMDNPLIVNLLNSIHFNTGRKHTEKAKLKMSIARKGKSFTEEHKKNLSEANKGKLVSEKSKRKMSASKINCVPWNKGIPFMQKENHPLWGKHHSEATRLKMSQNHADFSGSNHPNWNNGSHFLPYCHKFNKKLKEVIRQRDNNQCQNPYCQLTNNESLTIYKNKLSIHHVHYDKENCYPDLITLCNKCNLKANGNRFYHEQFYMNILNNRQLLFWNRSTL